MLKKVIYSLLLLSITDAAAMGKWFRALSSREDQIEEIPEDDACPVTPTALRPNPQPFVNGPNSQKEIASQEEATSEKGSLFFVHPSSIKARSKMYAPYPANMPQAQSLETLIRSQKIQQPAQESLYPTIEIPKDDEQPISTNLAQEMFQNKTGTESSLQSAPISDSVNKPTINYEERLKKIRFGNALRQLLAKDNKELRATTYYNTDIIPDSLKNLVYIKELPKEQRGISVLYMPADSNVEPPAFWFRLYLHNRILTRYQDDKNNEIGNEIRKPYTLNDLPASLQRNRDDVFKLLQTIQTQLKEFTLPETIDFIKKKTQPEIVSDEQQNNVQQQASLKLTIPSKPLPLAALQKKETLPSQHVSTNAFQQSSKKMVNLLDIVEKNQQYGKFAELINDMQYSLKYTENTIIPGGFVFKGATSEDTVVSLYPSETSPFFLKITPTEIQKITHTQAQDVTTETVDKDNVENFIQSNPNDPLTHMTKDAFLVQENLARNQKKIKEIKHNKVYKEIINGNRKYLFFIEKDKSDFKYKIATFNPLEEFSIEVFDSSEEGSWYFMQEFDNVLEGLVSNKKISKEDKINIKRTFVQQAKALQQE